MGDLLTPVTTIKKGNVAEKPKPDINPPSASQPTSFTEIPKILRDQPSFESVAICLRVLSRKKLVDDVVSLDLPSPLLAQILQVLVHNTVPDYWTIINQPTEDSQVRRNLRRCLRTIPGLGAIVAALGELNSQLKHGQSQAKPDNLHQRVEVLLECLFFVLSDERLAHDIWQGIQDVEQTHTKKLLLWKEFVTLAAASKVLSTAATAQVALKQTAPLPAYSWISDSARYVKWLGLNVASFARVAKIDDQAGWTALAQLTAKAISLGHSELLVTTVNKTLGLQDASLLARNSKILRGLPFHQQRKYLNSTISNIYRAYLKPNAQRHGDGRNPPPSKEVNGLAGLVAGLTAEDELLRDYLVDSLAESSSALTSPDALIQRSLVVLISKDDSRAERLLERSLTLFGNPLFINHSPIVQQETLAQTVLICAGYVHRTQPTLFHLLARSATQTQATSNRLGTTSPRARILGMIVATAISALTDKPDLRLKFDIEELHTDDAKWYLSLVHTKDDIGRVEDLEQSDVIKTIEKPSSGASSKALSPSNSANPTKVAKDFTGPRIIEVIDSDSDSDSDDDELQPYEKPDSDAEDDSEDPTLIRRDKPRAPVYIRDLIQGLREKEDYDKYFLALSNAAPLIRRKINFGSEIKDNLDELANIVVALQDHFEIDDFLKMRQNAMVAIVLSEPERMGSWMADAFFSGDYSISQRLAILSAAGLGARELAGFKDGDDSKELSATSQFPSKQLPVHLHDLYRSRGPTDSVDSLARDLEHKLMKPMALEAADQLSGPAVLKVRSFSSRISQTKTNNRRIKPIPNALAKIVAHSFFFPFTGRWWNHAQNIGPSRSPLITATTSSASTTPATPSSAHVLPFFLKTLALILQAAGPSTLSLPQMTAEFWDLLLHVRQYSFGDAAVLEALLFALLVMLEVNEEGADGYARLAREQSRELMETHEWVKAVYERAEGEGDEGEGGRVKMLSAGVLTRTGQVIQKFRREMLGDLADL